MVQSPVTEELHMAGNFKDLCKDIYEEEIVPLYKRRMVQKIRKRYELLFLDIILHTRLSSSVRSDILRKMVEFKNEKQKFQFCEKIVKKVDEYFKAQGYNPTGRDIHYAVSNLMVISSKDLRLDNVGLFEVLRKCNACISQLVKLPSNF